MDYDFSRLSTRSFEQLIQALSFRLLGSGITIFGDGPDGGREATFEGVIPYPPSSEPFDNGFWDGYGVIQAKFKQRPDGTGKDTDWALKDLKGELEKFTDKKRELRKPEFYIFVTNITLSSVAEKGGKDRANALINEFKSSLGLIDFRIWDYDQLRTMLDTYEDIRTTYNAWIMPGDVLSALMKSLELKAPDSKKIMRNFVQKEIRAEQYVKLGQADHNEQKRIPLAKVFVDLPISASEESWRSSTAMKELLSISGQLLNDIGSNNEMPSKAHRKLGRVVFVGGPGQGKSTLTQFFCQTHRVALLELEQSQPTSEVLRICRHVKEECESEKLLMPSMPRFPIRVELNQFATSLAKGNADSLFDYILKRIKSKTNYDLESEDLRKWLACYPWLIALDGLDEVPSSSNRIEVLDAVQDFLIDAHDCNADLLIISTTRPQGYNDDFSPKEYRHFQLAHLNTRQALHYAKRLIKQKLADDEDKIQMLLGRMQRASTENATARLMRSPLQVTIMTLLVESLGEPPKEKWKLFSEYYRVINTREKERDIPAARLLASFQTDIDTIHQRVGLNLQATSEKTGGTDALLSISEFDDIVESRLDEEGHTGSEADTLKKDIVSTAMERLVFLVAPKQEKIGFEIRSLQEYMAAECLMSADDETKRKNLRAIIFASHWRNVFLFAAGKCFHKEQHLRADIVQFCNELNEGDISNKPKTGYLEKLTLSGSLLALEILEDGAIGNQPNYMRAFLRLALRLLELPHSDFVNRLAELYDTKYSEIYKEEIRSQLSKSCKEVKIVTWQLLIQLKTNQDSWINETFVSDWPNNKTDVLEIIQTLISDKKVKITPWVSEIWASAILHLPIPATNDMSSPFDTIAARRDLYLKAPEGLKNIFKHVKEVAHEHEYKIKEVPDCFSILIHGVQEKVAEDTPLVVLPNDTHPTWHWVNKALNFWEQPSKDALHSLVKSFTVLHDKYCMTNISSWPIPWPVRSAVCHIIEDPSDDEILNSIANGDLGDTQDWLQAQERWKSNKLSADDVLFCSANKLPFDKKIGKVGYPSNIAGASISHTPDFPKVVDYMYELWVQSKGTPTEKYIKSNLIFLLAAITRRQEHESNSKIIFDLTEILSKDRHLNWTRLDILDAIPESQYKSANIDKVLRLLGEFETLFAPKTFSGVCEYIESQIIKSPESLHLLKLLTVYVVAGYQIKSPLLIIPTLEKNKISNNALIRLACIDNTTDITDIGSELLKLYSSTGDPTKDIIATIKNHKLSGERLEKVLCTLYQGLAVEKWKDRQQILEEMREQQQKHLSHSEMFVKQ